jgi:hypothetical protein
MAQPRDYDFSDDSIAPDQSEGDAAVMPTPQDDQTSRVSAPLAPPTPPQA